jgi:alpha-tubulin suppressor-like RCC1 family protein
MATDRVLCWGRNSNAELGDGSTNDRATPGYIAGSDAYLDIAVGGAHTCGVRVDGVVLCWGAGQSHQLGTGSTTSAATPTPIASGASFSSVAAGTLVSCAVAATGDAYCWGSDSRGMLGNGTANQSQPVPAPVVGGHSFTSLTVGGVTVCGLTTNGTAMCWGGNQYGQLGNGTIDFLPHSTPQPVAGGLRFTAISADLYHVCGVTAGGTTYCWGAQRHGMLGDGSLGMTSSPQRVSGW